MADTYAASDALVRRIERDSGQSDADWFAELKADAIAWRPNDYDVHQINLRHYYEGKIDAHLAMAVRKRFPLTGPKMPVVDFNWAKLYAQNGAAVYDYPPARHLERDGDKIDPEADGEEAPLPDDLTRAEDFAEMLKGAHLEVVMAEAERRVVLTKTVFLKVWSDGLWSVATGKPPPTRASALWACDVLIVPHPRCPASLATALAVLIRVAGDGGCSDGSTTWEVWSRSYVEDKDGNITAFDPWFVERVTEKSVKVTVGYTNTVETKVTIEPILWRLPNGGTSDTYPAKTLPIVEWHDGIADGCPYLDADRNLVNLFDTINASMMSEQFAVDMNAATPVVRITDEPQPRNIPLGPGMLTAIRVGDDIKPIPLTADFAGIRSATQALSDNLALTSRQSPSSYNAESNNTPTSGVALKIKNEAQIKARLEAVARAIEVESRLLAVMAEVHDFWRGTSIVDDGITFVMVPQDPPTYEDASVVSQRAIDEVTAGLISEAEARVKIGASRTIEDARLALDRIAAEKKARPSQLGQALNAIAMPFSHPQFGQRPPMPPQDAPPDTPPKNPPPIDG